MPSNNPLNAVAKRFGITVREARDIATAVSTATSKSGKFLGRGTAIKDIGTQVKETVRAGATGKKGTTAYTGKPGPMTKGSKAKGVSSPDYRVTKTKRK